MPSKRKFYKTTITVVVLSEEPIPDDQSLRVTAQRGYQGDYSLDYSESAEEIDGPTCAKALEAQRSDPSFFRLTWDGDDEDEDDDAT